MTTLKYSVISASVCFWTLLMCLSSCDLELLHENNDPNAGPLFASFNIDSVSNSGYDPSTVFFENNSTGGTTFNWNFGDPASGGNNTSTTKDPSHLYQNPGVYTVTLKVKNSLGTEEKTATQDITINETFTFSFATSGVGTRFVRLWDVLVLDNGDYLVLGGVGNSDDIELYSIRMDEKGLTKAGFPKEIEVTGKGELYDAVINKAGNIAATGYTNSVTFNDSKVAFFQLDQNMNMIGGFPKTYGTDKGGVGRCIIQTASGGYAIAGSINGPGGSDFFVTMLDGNGNQLTNFPRQYNEFDFTETATAIRQLPNGEFIMLGADQTLFRQFINRMDANGKDMDGSPFYIDNRDGTDFLRLPDGSLMIVGRALHRVDLNGNDFPGFPKDLGNRFSGTDIILTQEGDVVFVGQKDDDLVMYRTDLNGNAFPGYPKSFPSTDRTIANAVAQAPDGGFIMVGTLFSSNTKGYIVKTDANGVIR